MIESTPKILIIKSKQSELRRVEKFLREIFDLYKLSYKYFNNVFLCISEAVTNSIVHGNKGDSKKYVEIGVDCEIKTISVKITDEGEGFDFNELKDPTTKENIKKESGRGIHIIKSIADAFEFNETGNSLQFQIECK